MTNEQLQALTQQAQIQQLTQLIGQTEAMCLKLDYVTAKLMSSATSTNTARA